MISDWDEPTKADLREDTPYDYDKDVEETQDAFMMDERRECLRVKK